jgi:hypothetical protein
VTLEIVPVDEIVGLLATYDPGRLSDLKKAFPEQAELFRVGIVAGPTESGLRVKTEIALAGMRATVIAGDTHLKQLQSRLTRGQRLKLSSQIVTVLASSAVLGLLRSEAPGAGQYIAAAVSVVSSILSLFAERLSHSQISAVSIERVYLSLVRQQTVAEQLVDELTYAIKAEDFSRIETLIRRANVCSAAIKKSLRMN